MFKENINTSILIAVPLIQNHYKTENHTYDKLDTNNNLYH